MGKKRAGFRRISALLTMVVFLSLTVLQPMAAVAEQPADVENVENQQGTDPALNSTVPEENKEETVPAQTNNEQEVKEEPAPAQNSNEQEVKEEPAPAQNSNEQEVKEEPAPAQNSNEQEVKEEPAPAQNSNEQEVKEEPAPAQNSNEQEVKEEPAPAQNSNEQEVKEEPAPAQTGNEQEVKENPAPAQTGNEQEVKENPVPEQTGNAEQEVKEEPAPAQTGNEQEVKEDPAPEQTNAEPKEKEESVPAQEGEINKEKSENPEDDVKEESGTEQDGKIVKEKSENPEDEEKEESDSEQEDDETVKKNGRLASGLKEEPDSEQEDDESAEKNGQSDEEGNQEKDAADNLNAGSPDDTLNQGDPAAAGLLNNAPAVMESGNDLVPGQNEEAKGAQPDTSAGGFKVMEEGTDLPDSGNDTAETNSQRKAEIQVGDFIITALGEFPENAEIQAVPIPVDIATQLAGKTPLCAYDIRLVVDGKVWQPEEHGAEVQLNIRNVDESQEKCTTNIFHVKKDFLDSEGNLSEETLQQAVQEVKAQNADTEYLETDVGDNGYSFITSSFSGFVAVVGYNYDATLFNDDSENYAGVYSATLHTNNYTAEEAKTKASIGISSIADQNLPDAPTTESPAIIQGAAVGYDRRLGPTEYELIDPNRPRPEPYSEFQVKILEEQGQDGTIHKKPSGFDGTYVIVRLDVSEFFNGNGSGSDELYLHMEQKDNKALMPAATIAKGTPNATVEDYTPKNVFTDGLGNRSASYKLSDLVDPNGTTPYVDVIVFATAANVAGADAGKANTPNGDIPLSFYVDNMLEYNAELKEYDPSTVDPNDPNAATAYTNAWHKKFYDETKANSDGVSRYLVKGSDLALEVSVENSGENNETTYWSLKKSFEKDYYDLPEDKDPNDPGSGREVKMMSEVAITGELSLIGENENSLKKRTLDVNSYDVQVAKNTSSTGSETPGITLRNGWLTLKDSSNTTGAEVAIGNNAKFVIDKGGKLIIDETCQLEIEWDGATVAAGDAPQTDTLASGVLDLMPGGELVNNGVITIEGYEGKPQPQTTQVQESQKQCGEMTIDEGATLTNNGAMVVNGKLYNLGTLVNNGQYTATITSNDPDQGLFAYHKGIVVSWKDDVTQSGVKPGALINGMDSSGKLYPNARLINNGDILLNPGTLENHMDIVSMANTNIWLGVVTEAIIPINPAPETPTVVTKRITFPPVPSSLINYGTLINYGSITPATVVIHDNGSLGALSSPGDHPEYFAIENYGTIINNGYIYGPDSGKEERKTMEKDAEMIASVYLKTAKGSATLSLYENGVFTITFEDGSQLTGTFLFDGDMLVFVLADGTQVKPETNENGDFTYHIPMSDGSTFDFVLQKSFVSEVHARYLAQQNETAE